MCLVIPIWVMIIPLWPRMCRIYLTPRHSSCGQEVVAEEIIHWTKIIHWKIVDLDMLMIIPLWLECAGYI